MKPSRFIPRKGLKQYIPDQGWVTPASTTANVDSLRVTGETSLATDQPMDAPGELPSAPASAREGSLGEGLRDPLLGELLEQLHTPPADELTQHWSRIAAEVSELNHGMREQKRLRAELAAIDARLLKLRSTILNDLQSVQRIADQQLVQARLRSEVSTLAQNRLATRLHHPPE